MEMTPLTHMGITTQTAQIARSCVPEIPECLTWHFLPHTSGLWLRSCFTYRGQDAALDIMLTFTPPNGKWHVLLYQEGQWPDVLTQGTLTNLLSPKT